MIDHALAYARKIPVFVLGRDKKPLPGQGIGMAKSAATQDPVTIRGWFRRWPDANIHTLTGPETGFFVLDIDRHKDDGFVALALLEAAHGALPPTLTCLTGGGGEHRYFKFPGGTVKSSVGVVGKGLDIKGNKGSIVLPPSIHKSGKPYQWAEPKHPIADAPPWLVALTRPPAPPPRRPRVEPISGSRYGEIALCREANAVAGAGEGARRDTANNAAFAIGQLVGGNLLGYETAFSTLFDAALACGLPISEARKTIEDGLRDGALRPRVVA